MRCQFFLLNFFEGKKLAIFFFGQALMNLREFQMVFDILGHPVQSKTDSMIRM